ncbi:MAG: hypothetical protein EGS37_02280 [Ruthenibacterium lactatiformans]|nr:hypothetical protein [Ruthenibacterium lactatiformans]
MPARTYAGRANTLQHKRVICVQSAQAPPCAPERRTEENNERQRRTKRLVSLTGLRLWRQPQRKETHLRVSFLFDF